MQPSSTLHFGPFYLDGTDDGLWRGPQRCQLTAKASAVLRYLVEHPNRLVRRTTLMATVWPDVHVSDWALTTCISEIRHVLGDVAKAPRYIETVHRQGYRFIAPVTVADTPSPLSVSEVPPPPPRSALPAPELSQSPPTAAVLDEEHKLVTVLCCALADAPTLGARLGPERLYRLLQTIIGLAQEVLHPYGGTLTLATSAGFTAIFGAPLAQEDHARRAVLAALELRQRLHDFPALRAQLAGEVLTPGMGLHSGLVVVGSLGNDLQRLSTAVGEPLYVATRLQQQAAPGTILLSASTYALVQAEVQAAPCGTLDMDGQPTPMPLYTLQGLLRRHAGVTGRGLRAVSPFVGRERELALLHDCLAAVRTGQGQVVGLVGEPGMGKTRLLTEFCRRVASNQVSVYTGQCLSYGQATPYLPVRDLLRQVCGLVEGDEATGHTAAVQRRLHASGITAEDDVTLLLQLLDLPAALEGLEQLSPQARQARTFALLRHLIFDTAQQQPLILVVENLHWSDPTSEVWLASLVERLAGSAVLLLGTYRPGYQPTWGAHSAVTQLALVSLQTQDSRTVVQAVLGSVSLPEARLRAMVAQAGGNPFFLEELAWDAVEQGGRDMPGTVPETVHAVLAARMDRLPSEAKRLLQTASVLGMHMTRPLLQAVTELSDAELHSGLTQLQAAELLYEARVVPALTYAFKHALTHEVAYQSLLQSARQQYHQRTAQAVAERFPDLAETQPELLAYHYTEAGLAEEAVGYWQRASERSNARFAHVEAVAHCTTGLNVLRTLPDTPQRAQRELDMQIELGRALMSTKGMAAPETGHVYARTRELCRQVGDTARLLLVLAGLHAFYTNRGELQTARELDGERLIFAQSQHDPTLLMAAHADLGDTLYILGALIPARAHYEQAIALLTSQQDATLTGRVPRGVNCLAYLGLTLWRLGYPDQALMQLHAARTLAQELSHPYSLARVLCYAAWFHQFQREVRATQERAEAALALSIEQGFAQLVGVGMFWRGWALAAQGQHEEGIAQMHQGLAARQATGAISFRSAYLAMLAEAYGWIGQAEEGLRLLAEALAWVDTTGKRYYEAEVYRIKGEILLQQAVPDAPQAEACFQQALAIACRQQAKSWELRAAVSLSQLWQQQGKRAEAYRLLAEVYGWFTEGFDTLDLQEAKALLAAL